ncbi:MAG: hypothetical protein A2V85_16530 [Chloroflexi bacterium RBG_16_72_14]|nr:MAG: hypothetical protein A2V85_16530 [Chloroflexi bacterium RBG_16_72_14]
MSSEPRAFATVDHGTATVAASLLGRVDGRWRLLGSTAAPASVPADALVHRLRARLDAADPALSRSVGLAAAEAIADLPRVEARTTRPPVLVVVAATERVVRPLAATAATAGWRVRAMALEGAEILAIASALADPSVTAVLAGASDPPGADERPLVGELAALAAAATQRRPDLVLILAGGMSDAVGRTDVPVAHDRPGATLLAPAVATADGARLRALLDDVRGGASDGRRALSSSAATLAEVLRRRVEVVEVGQSAGARVVAGWTPGAPAPAAVSATVAAAALVPPGAEDTVVDEIAGWLTVPLDRLRLRDRLHELGLAPWGDATGEGALLRLAAARAALVRLTAATPAFDALPPPDLVVAAGGAWSVAPGPAVALALADVLRRPGVRALGLDHAGLLGPLGTIEDAAERERVISDLRDELLLPLGSVLMPGGLRAGHSAGRLAIAAGDGPVELDLVPGGLELVDLPPGSRAVVDLRFRDPVDLGLRGRHFALEVAGGLGGLLVDLRDVPLRLPARLERRRELLAAWQGALWTGVDA